MGENKVRMTVIIYIYISFVVLIIGNHHYYLLEMYSHYKLSTRFLTCDFETSELLLLKICFLHHTGNNSDWPYPVQYYNNRPRSRTWIPNYTSCNYHHTNQ